jgi:hypothetical protein
LRSIKALPPRVVLKLRVMLTEDESRDWLREVVIL